MAQRALCWMPDLPLRYTPGGEIYRALTRKPGESAMHVIRMSLLCAAAWAAMHAASLALDRPAWMDQPGIVMAGSWEEPSFRARRMGRTDYTLPADLQAQYAREHTPEMIAQLKDLGVNFVMIHC